MRILVTGWSGMLASALKDLDWKSDTLVFVDVDLCDITSVESIKHCVDVDRPQLIINCAGYTNVDAAEDIWRKDNALINAWWVYVLAKVAKEIGSDFITFSSDYVFDGVKRWWYMEDDVVNPINHYGVAKALGEQLCLDINPSSIVIRTSRLYGWWKYYKNFVNTMIEICRNKDEVRVINDQWWCPTYTWDLADVIKTIVSSLGQRRWKILHCSGHTDLSGVSWFDFACKIFQLSCVSIQCFPVASSEYPTKARRPQHSVLLNSYPELALPFWEEGLKRYVLL